MKIQRIAYLSLGANQESKKEKLQKAINLIADKMGSIEKISSIYKTESWGFNGDDFFNICIKVATFLNPEEVLKAALEIEETLGRVRNNSYTYINRKIDIDILLFDDEIIFSKDLLVPHPKMLQRKFVLVPLTEIAENVIHPIAKQTIKNCLSNSGDPGKILKTEDTLNRPISLSEKYNYIAIEGNIGAGKTSLANLLSDQFNAKIVLERFADNPFLPKFYKDKERFAFPLEMSFLADRYQQLSDDLAQFDLFQNFTVSDYYIFKSLIFAQITLQKEEYTLYRKMFDLMYKEIVKPDLYIYLYQNNERLLENISKRGRPYEKYITTTYLDDIHRGYKSFINTQNELNTLVIDVSELDFVNYKDDFKLILQKLVSY